MTINLFCGVIPDASCGLPLRLAMTWFAADAAVARNYSKVALRRLILEGTPGAVTADQLAQMESNRWILLRGLVENLRTGKLRARGFSDRFSSLVDIASEWWTDVTLDTDRNFAEAQGVRFVGLLVFETALSQPSSPVVKTDPGVWFRERMQQIPKPTRDAAMKACRDATHATSREVLAAWMALPAEFRRQRGRPPT